MGSMRLLTMDQTLFRYRTGMGLLFCVFTLPVLVPYYATKGIDASGFFFIEALFRFTYFLFSFFTGQLSDHGSRRGCLLLGASFWWLGGFIIFMGSGFWAVVVGEMILALGMALFVSSGRAYLYDLLLSFNRADDHPRQLSIQRSLENTTRMLATAAGGFLFVAWSEAPQLCAILTTTVAFGIFLYIPEPARHKPLESPASLMDLLKALHGVMKDHMGLINIMLYSASLVGVTTTVFWGIQPMMREADLPIPYVGLALAAAAGITAVCAANGHRIISRIGIKKILIILLPLSVFEMAMMTLFNHPLLLLLLFINSFIYAMVAVGIEDLTQRQVTSDVRATTVSLTLMFEMIFTSSAMLLMGIVTKVADLPWAFAVVGILLGLIGAVSLLFLMRVFSKLKTA
jgi:MFS family permease